MGTYLGADPIGLNIEDLNLYVYVVNHPINVIDTFGLMNIAGAYARFEGAMKPDLIGGALVVTGGVTTIAGAVTATEGFVSIPVTGLWEH